MHNGASNVVRFSRHDFSLGGLRNPCFQRPVQHVTLHHFFITFSVLIFLVLAVNDGYIFSQMGKWIKKVDKHCTYVYAGEQSECIGISTITRMVHHSLQPSLSRAASRAYTLCTTIAPCINKPLVMVIQMI